MAGSLYRIKLYGQSGDDPEAFAQSLAELLRIRTPLASALLRRTPVVIRENLTREEAENVREMIAVINGLCLVEAMDGAEEGLSAPLPTKERLAVKTAIFSLSATNMVWFGLGAVLLVIFFLGAFALTPKVSVREKAPGSVFRVQQGPTEGAAGKTALDLPTYEQTTQDLEQQISAIEEEIPILKKELMQVHRAQQAAGSGPNPNPGLARDNFLRSFEIREEIRVKQHRLRAVRSRLTTLRMKQGVKQPPGEK